MISVFSTRPPKTIASIAVHPQRDNGATPSAKLQGMASSTSSMAASPGISAEDRRRTTARTNAIDTSTRYTPTAAERVGFMRSPDERDQPITDGPSILLVPLQLASEKALFDRDAHRQDRDWNDGQQGADVRLQPQRHPHE